MKPSGYLTVCLFLVVMLSVPTLPLFAQAAQAKAPQTKTVPEYNAYNACYTEKDAAKKADLCEKFVAAFQDSDFLLSGYKLIIQSYYDSQNWKLLMDAADKVVALPTADSGLKSYAYESAMIAANNSNNPDKCVSYGDKVLAIDMDNFKALYTLSTVIARQYASDIAQLQRASNMARKALLMAASMMDKAESAQKPTIVLLDGTLHGTLGLISYHQKDYKKSIQEYQAAVKDNVKDDGSHFFMAYDYINLKVQSSQDFQTALKAENDAKAAKADQPTVDELSAKRAGFAEDILKYQDTIIDELAITVAINGDYATLARPELTKQWAAKNSSTAGLDEFVNQKKAQIGG